MAGFAAVYLSGWVTLPPHRRDAVMRALPEHIRRTRAEPGCLSFNVDLDPVTKQRLLVSESYVNADALAAHRNRLARSQWAVYSRGLERHYKLHQKVDP
ncbi:MAG: putative quinol monooxygenase [Brevirhabdus sp.]